MAVTPAPHESFIYYYIFFLSRFLLVAAAMDRVPCELARDAYTFRGRRCVSASNV